MTTDVVVNLRARYLGEASPVRAAILGAAERRGARVHETRTLGELDAVARGIAERGARAVVLAGGDGSHGAGVTALWRAMGATMPPVVLAPGGTVGIVASNLYGSRRRDVGALVDAAFDDDVAAGRSTPTLHVRDDTGGDRLAFIFGAGLVARFFESYDASPRQGLGVAARLAGRAALGAIVGTPFARRMLSPVSAAIDVDGETQRGDAWSLVLASVVRDVGLGVRATYRAAERADRFHVVASARSPRALATQIPRVLTGRAMAGGGVDVLAARLGVRFAETEGYVVDGDALRARDVLVEAGPCVRVLG